MQNVAAGMSVSTVTWDHIITLCGLFDVELFAKRWCRLLFKANIASNPIPQEKPLPVPFLLFSG